MSRGRGGRFNIIHVSIELRVAWRQSPEVSLAREPNVVVPYKILSSVIDSVKRVASSRLRLFNAPRANIAVSRSMTKELTHHSTLFYVSLHGILSCDTSGQQFSDKPCPQTGLNCPEGRLLEVDYGVILDGGSSSEV